MQHYKTKQTWCLLCRKQRIRSHSMAVVWKQQIWFGLIQCSWGSLLSFLDCREGKKSNPSVACPLCITILLLFAMSNTSNHWQAHMCIARPLQPQSRKMGYQAARHLEPASPQSPQVTQTLSHMTETAMFLTGSLHHHQRVSNLGAHLSSHN